MTKTTVYKGRVGDVVNVTVPANETYNKYSTFTTLKGKSESLNVTNSDFTPPPTDYFLTYGFSSQESLVFSGFSATNYIILPDFIVPSGDTWEVQFKVTTGSDITTNSRVTSVAEGSDVNVPVIGLTGSKWKLWLSSENSTSWDISNGVLGSSTVSTNTTYWLRLGWDGSTYTLKESTDGSSFTTIITIESSTPIKGCIYPNAVGCTKYNNYTTNQQPWLGSIDMSGFYYKRNGKTVFTTKRQVRLESAKQFLSNIFDENLLLIRDFRFSRGSLYLYGNYSRFTSPLEEKISITNTSYDKSKPVRILYLNKYSTSSLDYIKNYFTPVYFVAEVTGWDNQVNAVCKTTFLYYINWASLAKELETSKPTSAMQVTWFGSSASPYLGYVLPSPYSVLNDGSITYRTGSLNTAARTCSRDYGIIGYSTQQNVQEEPSDIIKVKVSFLPSANVYHTQAMDNYYYLMF